MKRSAFYAPVFLFLVISQSYGQQKKYTDYPISMVDINKVKLTDGFWLPKIKTIQNTTISFAFDKCQKEGRLENFLIAGGKKQGKVRGKMPFDDTDIYKIIEGASNSLISAPNNLTIPERAVLKLEKKANVLGGVNVITGNVPAKNGQWELKFTAIPYYAWSNCEAGTMKVWLPRK